MGNDEMAQELFTELDNYGFVAAELMGKIKHYIDLGMPFFTLQATRSFSPDRMDFVIFVQKGFQGQPGYKVTEIFSIYLPTVDLDILYIPGVDVPALDALMSEQDWQLFFINGKTNYATQVVMDNFSALLNTDNPAVEIVLMGLARKHFSREIYTELFGERGSELSFLEKKHLFTSKDLVSFSVDHAYRIAAEKTKDLESDLIKLLHGFFDRSQIEDKLYPICQSYPDRFELTFYLNGADRATEIVLPAQLSQRGYRLQDYTLTTVLLPDINHGVFNGVDTKGLEELMAKVNWKNDRDLFIFNMEGDLPGFTSDVNIIETLLHRLSQDKNGAKITDILRLKFHQGVTYFEDMIEQSAWDLLEQLPKVRQIFPVDMSLRKAISLLNGNAVQYPVKEGIGLAGTDWVMLPQHEGKESASRELIALKGPNRQDIENMLMMLQIEHGYFQGIPYHLLDGEMMSCENLLGKSLQLLADPLNGTLKVADGEGRPIPFNFQLDPGFTTPSSPQMQETRQQLGAETRKTEEQKHRKSDKSNRKGLGK